VVWHEDQRKKTCLLVIDKNRKRRESTPAPDLRINGERLKTLDINDACEYLGYLGTGLRTERNRRLLVFGSPRRIVAE